MWLSVKVSCMGIYFALKYEFVQKEEKKKMTTTTTTKKKTLMLRGNHLTWKCLRSDPCADLLGLLPLTVLMM